MKRERITNCENDQIGLGIQAFNCEKGLVSEKERDKSKTDSNDDVVELLELYDIVKQRFAINEIVTEMMPMNGRMFIVQLSKKIQTLNGVVAGLRLGLFFSRSGRGGR